MKHKNFKKAIKRLSTGNYSGWYRGYFIFIYRRPHGKWCCRIYKAKTREWLWREGFHGTSLPTIKHALQWAKFHVVPSCNVQYLD